MGHTTPLYMFKMLSNVSGIDWSQPHDLAEKVNVSGF